jgi:hypothetical protein
MGKLMIIVHHVNVDQLPETKVDEIMYKYKEENNIVDQSGYHDIKNIYLPSSYNEVKCIYPVETTKISIYGENKNNKDYKTNYNRKKDFNTY